MTIARPCAASAAFGLLIALATGGLGCGETVGPTPTSPLAGTYAAASIVRQQDELSDEFVERGARFDLILVADSTLSGHVVLPANLRATGESPPVDQDLSGRWSLRANQIRLRLDRPVLGNQPTLAAVNAGLVGTLVVPDPVNGVLWLRLLLVRTAPPEAGQNIHRSLTGMRVIVIGATGTIGKAIVQALSPPWITETLQALGMPLSGGLPAAVVARAYLQSLEVTRLGLSSSRPPVSSPRGSGAQPRLSGGCPSVLPVLPVVPAFPVFPALSAPGRSALCRC